jgi:pimeloyl-ACP methyl ester carboxylesterase
MSTTELERPAGSAPAALFDGPRNRTVLANGLSLAWLESGDPNGPPLLFIHGYSDSSFSFSPIRPHLAAARCISVDLRGHGQSDKPRLGYTLGEMADDVRQLMDARGIDRAVLVGHSLGSLVAQRLAAFAPKRVAGLVLIGSTVLPPVRRGDWLWSEISALSAPPTAETPFLLELQANPGPLDPAFMATVIDESLRLPLHVWRGVLDEITDRGTAEIACQVTAETLILWGDQDPFFDAQHQAALRAAMPAATFHAFTGVGHNPHWERPSETATLILNFVRELASAGSNLGTSR